MLGSDPVGPERKTISCAAEVDTGRQWISRPRYGLQSTLPHRQRSAFACLPGFIQQRWHTFGDRVDTQCAGKLQDLHDLLDRGIVAERVADMRAKTRQIEVRGGSVDCDVDQLADLRWQSPILPRH